MSTEHRWRNRSPNLKRRERPRGSGRYYYSYIHPITKQEVGMGTDFEKANAAARVLGNKFMQDPVRQLVIRVDRPRALFHATLDAWFVFWQQDSKPSQTTVKNIGWRISKIKREIPDKGIASVEQFELASFIDTLATAVQNRYRDLLQMVFAYAVAKGLRQDNPAAGLLRRAKAERKRARLSSEQYAAIHAAASPHLKLAMNLIRLSLQRPGDLCALVLAQAWDGTTLRLEQGKTGTRLAIKAHPELRKAINAAAKYRISDCPALLCYDAPRRAINHRAADRFTRHWAQCTEELLSREFTAVARALWPKQDSRPTLYECKSLGVSQYLEAGWPLAKVQSLAGHEENSTTAIYSKGHQHFVPVDLTA